MAKLLTNHDPGHIHAIFGFVAMFHFLWRGVLIYRTGGNAFPTRTVADFALVLVHGCLPMLSLLLPLPRKRNFQSPMIWPEFRLHSIIFASRHVLATIYWLFRTEYNTNQDVTYSSVVDFLMMLALCHATILAASAATKQHGCAQNRTTNAMPYDKHVPGNQVKAVKKFYTFAQFTATAFIFSGNPTLAFIPLTGIQSAPFMMTLVRKGKCNATTYHFVYVWSLFLPGFACIMNAYQGSFESNYMPKAVTVMGAIAYIMRCKLNMAKHLVWIVAPVIARFAPVEIYKPPVAIFAVYLTLVLPKVVTSTRVIFRPTVSTPPWVADYGLMIPFLAWIVFFVYPKLSHVVKEAPMT